MPASNYWAMGVAGALGLFLSIIFHELSHSLMARRFGILMKGITLFIFGGVAEMSEEPPSARAGVSSLPSLDPFPACSLPPSFTASCRSGRLRAGPRLSTAVLFYLVWVNFILALFNLLPAFPLDGGQGAAVHPLGAGKRTFSGRR